MVQYTLQAEPFLTVHMLKEIKEAPLAGWVQYYYQFGTQIAKLKLVPGNQNDV